jgi:hypothetical protein
MTTNVGEDEGKKKPSYTDGQNISYYIHLENSMEDP